MRTRNSTTTNDDLTVGLDTILGGYWGLGYFNTDSTGFRTRFIEQDPFNNSTDRNCEVGALEDTWWQVSNGSRVTWGAISNIRDS